MQFLNESRGNIVSSSTQRKTSAEKAKAPLPVEWGVNQLLLPAVQQDYTEALEAELDECRQCLQAANAQITALRDKLAATVEAEARAQQLDRVYSQLDAEVEKGAHQREATERLEAQIQQKDEELQKLSAALVERERAMNASDSCKREWEITVAQLKSETQQYQRQRDDASAKLQSAVQRVESLEKQYAQVRCELSVKHDAIAAMKLQLGAVQDELHHAQAEAIQERQNSAGLARQLDAISASSELEKQQRSAEHDIWTSERSALNQALQRQTDACKTLEAKVKDEANLRGDLQRCVEEKSQTIRRLETRLADAEEKHLALKKESETAAEKLRDSEKQHAEFFARQRADSDRLQREIENAKAAVKRDWEMQLMSEKSVVERQKAELAHLREEHATVLVQHKGAITQWESKYLKLQMELTKQLELNKLHDVSERLANERSEERWAPKIQDLTQQAEQLRLLLTHEKQQKESALAAQEGMHKSLMEALQQENFVLKGKVEGLERHIQENQEFTAGVVDQNAKCEQLQEQYQMKCDDVDALKRLLALKQKENDELLSTSASRGALASPAVKPAESRTPLAKSPKTTEMKLQQLVWELQIQLQNSKREVESLRANLEQRDSSAVTAAERLTSCVARNEASKSPQQEVQRVTQLETLVTLLRRRTQ